MNIPTELYKKIFVSKGILSPEKFDKIAKSASQARRPLDQILLESTLISQNQYLQLLASYFDMPYTELKVGDIDKSALEHIPENFATKHMVFPFAIENNELHIAMANPTDKEILNGLATSTDYSLKPFVASEISIKRALILYSGNVAEILDKILKEIDAPDQSKASQTDESHVTTLANRIVESAVLLEASDIHIEPFETEVLIRFRISGVLKTIAIYPPRIHNALISRYKILSNLKVDQKRIPQDGRFTLNIKDQEINARISLVPSYWGEKVVIRVLPKEAHLFDLTNIGLSDKDLKKVQQNLKRPYGLILVCGPTGSGKTTSLYSFLQEIGSDKIDAINISTIEDPIEYTMARVTQIQIHPEIDLTFANGLRSLLRQDPDIIMVGEIRDEETANFSVRASLVGRLVLSSLHTNNAIGAIPRLLDIGVEPYLVSSTLSLVVAQRLARKLCTFCRQSDKPDQETIQSIQNIHDLDSSLKVLSKDGIISKTQKISDLRFFKAVGCDRCDNTGYQGRVGVFELLEISDKIRDQINGHEHVATIYKTAREEGMKTMFEDGLSKVLLGETDVKELLRVTYS
jgi:type IV pilus assembly protein PilB